MRSATTTRESEIVEEQRRIRFECAAKDFFRRWQPAEPDEAAQFSVELFTLVRQIYIDAAAPFAAQYAEAMRLNLSGIALLSEHPARTPPKSEK